MRQDVLIDLENYINSKNQEFQALGDQIRVYLNNGGEITLTVTNSTITVLTYNIENFTDSVSLMSIIICVGILIFMCIGILGILQYKARQIDKIDN